MKAPCRECTLVKEVDANGRCAVCAEQFPPPPEPPPCVEIANADAWWVKVWG